MPFALTILTRSGMETRKWAIGDLQELLIQAFTKSAQIEHSLSFNFNITKILKQSDLKLDFNAASKAKRKELKDLARRETWKILASDGTPNNTNIRTSELLVTLNDTGISSPKCKAWFAVPDSCKKDKDTLDYSSTFVKLFSVHHLVALAACFSFTTWSQEISQAYLQPARKLPRKLSETRGAQLLLPHALYRLSDFGDYQNTTFSNHKKKINKTPLSKPTIFFQLQSKT